MEPIYWGMCREKKREIEGLVTICKNDHEFYEHIMFLG